MVMYLMCDQNHTPYSKDSQRDKHRPQWFDIGTLQYLDKEIKGINYILNYNNKKVKFVK